MNSTLLLAVLPLVLISLGLEIFALIDLVRRDKRQVQGNNKWLWALVIIAIGIIGPVVYLLVGRTEGRSY